MGEWVGEVESKLSHYYVAIHNAVCGQFPNENILHEQFLSSFRHHRTLVNWLKGKDDISLLDVGCGEQPYRTSLRPTCSYIGIDVDARHSQTLTIQVGHPWPIEGPFDVVLCTQVIEHVADLGFFCKEVDRVLAPGGQLVLSVPFLYPVHDAHDYRRLTPSGMAQLFPNWSIETIKTFGGIGSTLVLLINTWVDNVLSGTWSRRIVKGLIFPIRLPLHAVLNAAALCLDWIDRSDRYFHNSLVVLRKEAA